MERRAAVYVKGTFAGILTETDGKHYAFRYDDAYNGSYFCRTSD